jgi:hypothetical protein
LGDTQHSFIKFLERKSGMQRQCNDFCESYNRFADEYPTLLRNGETREELMNRLNILSAQFWETIKTRKDESLAERNKQMEGGWVSLEMANLTSSIARLVELEYERFGVITAILTGIAVNDDCNL